MNRRSFIQSILAAGVAPAFVKAEILMPVRSLILPPQKIVVQASGIITQNTAILEVIRSWTVSHGSPAHKEAISEGLVEIRRQGHEVTFALDRPYRIQERDRRFS